MIDNSPYYFCPKCGGSVFTIQQTYNVKAAEDAIPEPIGTKHFVCINCHEKQNKAVNEVPKKTIY